MEKEGGEELIQICLSHIKKPFCAHKCVATYRVYLPCELDPLEKVKHIKKSHDFNFDDTVHFLSVR